MPRFLVRAFVQCALPDVTPDQSNALAQLPKRMLYELPPFMGPLLARSGAIDVADSSSGSLAMLAANAVLPEGFALQVLPQGYAHREIDGTYVASGDGSQVFIVGTQQGADIVPLTTKQTFRSTTQGPGQLQAVTKSVDYEFRCHLVVTPL